IVHFFGLNERQCLKEFIHSAKTARENDKGFGILDEHGFAYKEVAEIKRDVKVWIRLLLKGEFYVATYRDVSTFLCPFVGSFHYARATTGYNAKRSEERRVGKECRYRRVPDRSQ